MSKRAEISLLIVFLTCAFAHNLFATEYPLPMRQKLESGFYSPENIVSVNHLKNENIVVKNYQKEFLRIRPLRVSSPGFSAPFYNQNARKKENPKDGLISISSKLKPNGLPYTQILSLCNEGLSLKVKYDESFNSAKMHRMEIILPIENFYGKTILIDNGKSTKNLILPEKETKKSLINDWKGTIKSIIIPLNIHLKMKLVFKKKKAVRLGDYRKYRQQNYVLGLDFKDAECEIIISFLSDKKYEYDLKTKINSKKKNNLLKEGSSFEVGEDGFQALNIMAWTKDFLKDAVPPLFDDSTAVHGKYSLKIVKEDQKKLGGRFSFNGAQFLRMPLEAGKKYTLSAWMKTDTPGFTACLFIGEKAWSQNAGQKVKLTREWKRYSTSFCPKEFKKTNYCFAWIGASSRSSNVGTLWIDAVQVEEDDLSNYSSGQDMEFGVSCLEGKDKLFSTSDKVSFQLKFRNNSLKGKSVNCKYNIYDYWGKTVRSGDVDITLKPQTNKNIPVNLKLLPPGYYKGELTLSGDSKETEELIFGVYTPWASDYPDWDNPVGCHDSPNEMLKILGIGWIRSWHFRNMDKGLKESPNCDYTMSDFTVAEAKKHNIKIMATLGEFSWKWGIKYVPTFAIDPKKCPNPADKTKSHSKNASLVIFPKMLYWKKYIQNIVERYKNDIKYWEIYNEPNLYMTAEQYLPYLKAAYITIKKIDPDAKVIGLCSTSDLGGQALDFIGQSIKLGALQYMDILSVHLYDAYRVPETTRGIGTDMILKRIKKLMKKSGREIPVWHTEKAKGPAPLQQGYSFKKLPAPSVLLEDKRWNCGSLQKQCQDFVREYLLSYMFGTTGNNGGKTFWHGTFTKRGGKYSGQRSNYPFSYAIHEYDNSPRPALIAANAFAHAMKGCRPWKALDAGGNYRCHIYKGKNKVVVALWNWQEKQDIKLKVGSIPYRLTNVFGASIKTPEEKGVIKIILDKDPKYLHLATSDIKKVESMFLNIESQGFKSSIRAELINDKNSKTGLSFCVEAKNSTPVELNGTISIECPEGWGIASSERIFAFKCLKPHQKISKTFPFSSIGNCKNSVKTFTVNIMGNGYKRSFCVNVPLFNSEKALKASLKTTDMIISKRSLRKKVIDGEFSDWNDDDAVYMTKLQFIKSNSNKWKDPLDLSCSLRSRYDNKFIYFAACVIDDVVDSDKLAKAAYRKDALELFFDIDLTDREYDLSDSVNHYNEDDHQVYFAPADGKNLKKASAWYGKLKSDGGMKVASQKHKLGYNMEIAIPLSMLKLKIKKGKKIGFSFSLDDSDNGKQRETVFVWHGDLKNYKEPSLLGQMIFK